MERKIDRAVDHDGCIGTNPQMPIAPLSPLARAMKAGVRAVVGRKDTPGSLAKQRALDKTLSAALGR